MHHAYHDFYYNIIFQIHIIPRMSSYWSREQNKLFHQNTIQILNLQQLLQYNNYDNLAKHTVNSDAQKVNNSPSDAEDLQTSIPAQNVSARTPLQTVPGH